jgi:hypothetical protein
LFLCYAATTRSVNVWLLVKFGWLLRVVVHHFSAVHLPGQLALSATYFSDNSFCWLCHSRIGQFLQQLLVLVVLLALTTAGLVAIAY